MADREKEEVERLKAQLKRCASHNAEEKPVGIGDIQYYWNTNTGKWSGYVVDGITILENGSGSYSGTTSDGERHWSRSHETYTTSDPDEARAIRDRLQDEAFNKSKEQ